MEEKCSNAIAYFLSSQIPEAKGKEKILKYGLELMITALVGLLLMACVSLIAGYPLAWLPFLLGFAPLRTTAGGFHASSHLGCYCITTVTFSICMMLALLVNSGALLYVIIAGLSLVVVLAFSPVEARNKPLSPARRVANRHFSLLIAGIELIISLLLFCVEIQLVWITLLYYGILAASISIVAVKISTLIERRLHNES